MSTNTNNKKRKKSPARHSDAQPQKKQNLIQQNLPINQQQQPIQYVPYRQTTAHHQQITSQNQIQSIPMPQLTQQTTPIFVESNLSNMQNQNLSAEEALLKEIAEKRKARAITTKPPNIHLIKSIDDVSKCTNADILMLSWLKDFVFDELVGIVVYARRGLTTKNKWDRCDLLIQVGQPHEREKVSVFSWGSNAGILEGAKLNNKVALSNLVVVPEDVNRANWSGTIDFKLKFGKGSTLTILEEHFSNQQQEYQFFADGPSTSAAGTSTQNVQTHQMIENSSTSIGSNAAATDPEIEYHFTDI